MEWVTIHVHITHLSCSHTSHSVIVGLQWNDSEETSLLFKLHVRAATNCICLSFLLFSVQLVTRAVRVVDLITNLDMTAFHSLGGWDKMLERLKMEVEECKEDAPTILPSVVKPTSSGSGSGSGHVPMETDVLPTTSVAGVMPLEGNEKDGSEIVQCMPERSALIKSILNFLKKAIPDPTFAENIRNCELVCAEILIHFQVTVLSFSCELFFALLSCPHCQ